MLYWIFIIALIVEIILYIKVFKLIYVSVLETIVPITLFITGIITIILTVFIIDGQIKSKPNKVELESMYRTLLEYKSDLNCTLNEHYISDVVFWNTTISVGKEMQRDFWLGIFIPNIYDEFDIITFDTNLNRSDKMNLNTLQEFLRVAMLNNLIKDNSPVLYKSDEVQGNYRTISKLYIDGEGRVILE